MLSIADLRRQALLAREALDDHEIENASGMAIHHLQRHPIFLQARHIATYWAVGNELEPASLMHTAWKLGKKLYLPIINVQNTLHFAPLMPTSQFYENHFYIPEPTHHRSTLAAPGDMDLVLMPVVGFDACGKRIGMGGGFYDRSFAFKRTRSKRKPLLIGMAFDVQYVEGIAQRYWDVKLDGVLTESGLTLFY